MNPLDDAQRSQRLWLRIVFWGVVGIVIISSFLWIVNHKLPSGWDHAGYIDQGYIDSFTFKERGLTGLFRSFLRNDTARPPAYRILATPITTIPGLISTSTLGLLSLLAFAVTLILVFFAARTVAGNEGAGFAVIILLLSPVIIFTVRWFGTEYVTFLGVAGTLYFLLRSLNRPGRALDWIGLGIALALGFLSKATFLTIAVPILVTTAALRLLGVIKNPGLGMLIKASILGGIVASPWWVFNYRSAIDYATSASDFVRHSIANSLLGRFIKWPGFFMDAAFGPAISLLLILVVVYLVFKLLKRTQLTFPSSQSAPIAICLAGAIPLLILHIAGSNQNMRLIAPAVIPLAISAGIMVFNLHWFERKLFIRVAAILILVQFAAFTILPNLSLTLVNPTVYPDQWDWQALKLLAEQHGLASPNIGYVGNGDSFNPPQIDLPWAEQDESVSLSWIWQYEAGDIQWGTLMNSLNSYDIILTAPGYVGNPTDKQDLDNAHNAEFASRLRQDPRFAPPITLTMGSPNPVSVLVFFKTTSSF